MNNTHLIEKDVLVVYMHYSILQYALPAALCTGHLITQDTFLVNRLSASC